MKTGCQVWQENLLILHLKERVKLELTPLRQWDIMNAPTVGKTSISAHILLDTRESNRKIHIHRKPGFISSTIRFDTWHMIKRKIEHIMCPSPWGFTPFNQVCLYTREIWGFGPKVMETTPLPISWLKIFPSMEWDTAISINLPWTCIKERHIQDEMEKITV